MNEKGNSRCDRCGSEFEPNELTDFNGKLYCSGCLERETVVCLHCGERIRREDNAGEESFPLCRNCFTDHYTICQNCGHVIHQDDAHYHDDYDEDGAYCGECFVDENDDDEYIHDYSYKPDPVFYGNGNRFFGVELEIDCGGESSSNANELLKIGNSGCKKIYIKHDGSLNEGMEIVTYPMTLDYHKYEMPWLEVMNKALEMHYLSHKSNTCGLHVHVNRSTFGSSHEKQEDAISRVLYFVEHHWNELLKFSRRTEYQMSKWAARYGYKNNPKDILDHAKKDYDNRYTCVNITNYDTVEFRMFRGTLKYNTLIATLELVDMICEFAINLSDDEIHKISWSEFVMRLDEINHAELITYLKERQLYVNSPFYGEEEK